MKPFPNKPPHEAIPNQNRLEVVRLLCYRAIVFLSCLIMSYRVIVYCISSAQTSSQSHQPYTEKTRFQHEAGSPPNERFAIRSWWRDSMQNNIAITKTPQWRTTMVKSDQNWLNIDMAVSISNAAFFLIQHIETLSDSLDLRQSIRICVQQPDCTHNLSAG